MSKILLLLFLSVFLTACQNSDKTPLMQAASVGNLNKIQDALENKANINTKDTFGFDALMYAIRDNQSYAVDFLLTQGASSSSVTSNGTTALMIAATTGNLKIINSLLNNGANINVSGNKGTTALMAAAGSGKIEAMNLLLAKGANPCLKDIYGKTALQTAFDWWGQGAVLKILENYPNSKKLFCTEGT